jgi:hypothetical protein
MINTLRGPRSRPVASLADIRTIDVCIALALCNDSVVTLRTIADYSRVIEGRPRETRSVMATITFRRRRNMCGRFSKRDHSVVAT